MQKTLLTLKANPQRCQANPITVMGNSSTIVIFFNDWQVFPGGINAGGGESATISLARAFKRLGHRVIACANLPNGDCLHDGVEFWNFTASYNLALIEERLSKIGPYICIAATLVHPFLVLPKHKHCRARILLNHSPSPFASGLEPATVMNLIDRMICVSQAQRSHLIIRGVKPYKLKVVKNGFEPDIFKYAGPEERNWNKLVFIGRLEWAKGIHLLVTAFSNLLTSNPNLELSIFGDFNDNSDFSINIRTFIEAIPQIKLHGKVPQNELARHLQNAGLLIFPSIGLESAGLAVVDAQASGCPSLAFNTGGVSEYLYDQKCGKIIYDQSTEGLHREILQMLSNREELRQMSINCASLGRQQSWDLSAQEIIEIAHQAETEILSEIDLKTKELPRPCTDTIQWTKNSVLSLEAQHELIGSGNVISLEEAEQYCKLLPDYSAPYLWRGLLLEGAKRNDAALESYYEALSRSAPMDWQPLFRITMLQLDLKMLREATVSATKILQKNPSFHYSEELKKIISISNGLA